MMAILVKWIMSSWKFLRRYWDDPVISKVYAAVIIAIGGALLTLLGLLVQAIFQKVPFNAAYHNLSEFLGRTTLVSNGLIVLVLLILVFVLLINTRLFRKRTAISEEAKVESGPTAFMQRFGLQPGDSDLVQAFSIVKGSPKLSTQIDNLYGPVMEFDINFGADQVDSTLYLKAQQATRISYIYMPIENNFVLYLRLHVTNESSVWPIQKWIALRLDVAKITDGTNQVEKAYPVKWTPENGDWVSSSLNIPDIVQEVFGSEGLVHHRLLGFRIRGKGKIARIVLS